MKKSLIAAAGIAAAILSQGAMAQAYVSGHVGASHVSGLDCSGVASCSTGGTSFRFTGGYKFAKGISGEIGYIDFGKAEASDTVDGIHVNVFAKAQAFTLGAAFEFPFNEQFSAGARLGAASVKTTLGGSAEGFNVSMEETQTKPYYGLFATIAVAKNFKIEAAADFTQAEFDGESNNVRSLSAGVRYEF